MCGKRYISCSLPPLLHRCGDSHVNGFEGCHYNSLWMSLHWCLHNPVGCDCIQTVINRNRQSCYKKKGHGPEVMQPSRPSSFRVSWYRRIGPGSSYCGNCQDNKRVRQRESEDVSNDWRLVPLFHTCEGTSDFLRFTPQFNYNHLADIDLEMFGIVDG